MITFTLRGDQVLLNPSINSHSDTQSVRIEGGYVWQAPEYTVRITATNPDQISKLGPQSGIVLVELLDIKGNTVQVYKPMNPGQEAQVQSDLSGLGEGYARFSTGALVNDMGQPWVGSILLIGCGKSGKDIPFDLPRGDGLFDVDKCKPVQPCFLEHTEILTDVGAVPAWSLSKGDLVWTFDNGFQPIVGISKQTYAVCNDNADLAPYCMQSELSLNKLYVSKHHRIFYDNKLISAHHLSKMENVEYETVQCNMKRFNDWNDGIEFTYMNIFLETHEIICANGYFIESGYLGGDMAAHLSGIDWSVMQCYAAAHRYKPARPFINHKGKLL